MRVVNTVQDAAALELRLYEDDTLLATLRPTSSEPLPSSLPPGTPDSPGTPNPSPRLSCLARLSRFALLRFDPDVNHMVLECPLGLYRLVIHAPAVATFVFRLGNPEKKIPAEEAAAAHLSPGSMTVLMDWLALMRALELEQTALTPAGTGQEITGAPATEENADLAHWEFHDLLFHAQSRPGRRTGRIRPYRWRGVFEPMPVVKPPMGEFLALPAIQDRPERTFDDVLAARRSYRTFSDTPLSLEALSTFLAHACRIQNIREDDLGGVSFRPSPSAGALHGLEIYVLSERCQGLARALHHYDPLRHGLECLPAAPAGQLDLLAAQAKRMAASSRPPAAYFVITARFRRYQWKYAQLAYSVMLKDLGCQHQTMSLVAEALGLTSVILGDTPTEPFQSLTGLPWLRESPVGSFSLGLNGATESRKVQLRKTFSE